MNEYQHLTNFERNKLYEAKSQESLILPYKDALDTFYQCISINEKISRAWENFMIYKESHLENFNEPCEIMINASVNKVKGEIYFFIFNGQSKNISIETFNVLKNEIIPLREKEPIRFSTQDNCHVYSFLKGENWDTNHKNWDTVELSYDNKFKSIEEVWNNLKIMFTFDKYPKKLEKKYFLPMPKYYHPTLITEFHFYSITFKREDTHLATADLIQKPGKYSLKNARNRE